MSLIAKARGKKATAPAKTVADTPAALEDESTINPDDPPYVGPVLYHTSKNGQLREWAVWVEGADIVTRYGVVGGEMQYARKTAVAKSVGKKNATTPEQQAVAEAEAMWKHKVERKYSETEEAAQEPVMLPMLAHKFSAKKVRYPATAQAKLDGVRCVARKVDGVVELMSRGGKPYDVAHIVEALDERMSDGDAVDGEIYIHGMSRQQIISLVKNTAKSERVGLQYWMYDVPINQNVDDAPWCDRARWLEETCLELEDEDAIVMCPTRQIGDEHELKAAHGSWVAEGYEGTIIRNYEGQYLWGYRSHALLKYKDFHDAEFEVVGFTDGKGKFEGCVIWRCASDGGEFNCSMACPMPERKQYFQEGDQFIGRKLTVRYQHLSDDGIPQFPVGVAFRPDEDLG